MNYPRRFPLRASAALTALFALAVSAAPLRGVAAQESARRSSSGVNGKIAFQSTQGGDGFTNDIYVMDADGKRQTRLTDSANDDTYPVWSPQGDKIAYLSGNESGYEIYLMNADGTNQRPLRGAADGGPVRGVNLQWSPDGTMLKYETYGNVHVIEAVAPGGGDSVLAPQNLSAADSDFPFDTDASWSSDGSKLVFISTGFSGDLPQVWTTTFGGAVQRTQLTTSPGAKFTPASAGGLIAFGTQTSGREIWVMNADGTNQHSLPGTSNAWTGPFFSPDGSRIAYTALSGAVFVVNADGSNPVQVSDAAGTGTTVFWSPDGTKVAFQATEGTQFFDIYVAGSDGTSRRASNYTKTRRADEFAYSWQRLAPAP
ncbi:MAG TPA: hypothetical protein VGX48_01775 [Pyrinomonadaceae bacterium]|jgi:TolB protein|nr:hypothetical protein [Pyrinomonadaceae bacterium]